MQRVSGAVNEAKRKRFFRLLETVDLTVYCRKLVCNSLKSEENMSALFVTRIDIF